MEICDLAISTVNFTVAFTDVKISTGFSTVAFTNLKVPTVNSTVAFADLKIPTVISSVLLGNLRNPTDFISPILEEGVLGVSRERGTKSVAANVPALATLPRSHPLPAPPSLHRWRGLGLPPPLPAPQARLGGAGSPARQAPLFSIHPQS